MQLVESCIVASSAERNVVNAIMYSTNKQPFKVIFPIFFFVFPLFFFDDLDVMYTHGL